MKKASICTILMLLSLLSYGYNRKGKCVTGDCQSGNGKFIYEDGSEYNGSWKNGKRHGYGQMIWLQTSLMKYRFDSQQGPYRYDGKVYPVDPIIYPILTIITNVKERKKKKFFDELDPDVKYIGQWAHDAMNGMGTLYLNDGTIMYGRWKNNRYAGEK